MISNARGKHSSPGVYIEEIEKSYSTKSLGVTTLGVVGETLKGPAFEPIRISNWTEFQEYFGGTSTEKFIGTKYPKYELPYIAKSYLTESNQLEVCRVLGFSGYNAGPAFIIYGNGNENKKHIIAILRSKGSYDNNVSGDTTNDCNPSEGDTIVFDVDTVDITASTNVTATESGCTTQYNTVTGKLDVSAGNLGLFLLTAKNGDKVVIDNLELSLDKNSRNYIVDVLGMNPNSGNYPLFVEEMYDFAHEQSVNDEIYTSISATTETGDTVENYLSPYREAVTPWFVSDVSGNGTHVDLKKLFRFHTISDGNAANSQIKISIANILPEEGLFDVYIRDYNDIDASPVILERFNKCNMIPGTQNYIGLRIGTFDGEYSNKSKYVTVEISENENIENCVPFGFLGYPIRKISGFTTPTLAYNTKFNDSIKTNRQFFGMREVDSDVLTFKGKNMYKDVHTTENGYSNGFHLDWRLNTKFESGSGMTITVDGSTGYSFTVPEKYDTEITNILKFTCYPYGGFDGWDIYRTSRTNTDDYKANKYKYAVGTGYTFNDEFDFSAYGLTGKSITSDYYAYLAGYKQFDNPNKVDINLFATPGIDYVNNKLLVNDVLDIIEESRQGDCLYVVTTPDKNKDGNVIEPSDAVQNIIDSEINSSYTATYYPWVKCYDSTDKKYISLPVTKDVVRNFAYTDNVLQPWFASAGMSRGNVDCVKANHFTRLEEEDELYENMINPVKSFSSDGVKIWGNKTMYFEDTPLNRINVRRLMIRLKKTVTSSVKGLIFEQNDNEVAEQFKAIVSSILDNAKQNRGISDYKIQVDTSAEARDRKELPAKIWVKPINCLEYISISFTITPEGASFED